MGYPQARPVAPGAGLTTRRGRDPGTQRMQRETTRRAGRSGAVRARAALAKFVVLFAVLLVAMEVVYHAAVLPLPTSNLFNRSNAAVASGVLSMAGRTPRRDGVSLSADGGRPILVEWGCDGLEPIGIFAAGLVAFPCAWRRKAIAAAIAIPVLLALNILRVATLALASAHLPASFEVLHSEVWPAALVLAAVVLWLIGAAWAASGPRETQHAAP